MHRLLFFAVAMLIAACQSPNDQVMIVAHRGASHDAPENTIPAFLLALEQGADAIEGDFFLTADNEIVCIHDARTGRVSDMDLVVEESTLEELRQLDVGSWKGAQWAGTGMPALSEVFALVPPGIRIFLDIKSGPQILPRLYEEIENSGLDDDQVVLIAFNAEVVRQFKEKRPQHKAYWLSGLSLDDDGNVTPSPGSAIETLKRIGADGFSSHHGLITKEYIEQVLDAGFEYHVWTVNDPERAWELAGYGAMSITTDVPLTVREFFENKRLRQ
ncbi:MAG: glycerophosphodiester phosphodiesterase [Marinilabiliales bacterium]|nr:MAG: glycerophosphodiester phosphodiesterase [Marinilabiliales bacterium]